MIMQFPGESDKKNTLLNEHFFKVTILYNKIVGAHKVELT